MAASRDIEVDFTFDIDTVQREKTYEPFKVKMGERVVTFTDPALLTMEQLMEIDHPVAFLEYCVPEADLAHVREHTDKMAGWRFNTLMERYNKHFGIGKRGNSRASRI